MSDDGFDCDILIAGYGPVGAMLAALLVQQGLRVIVAERDTQVYPLPRAAHVDHEIMRLFQQVGIVDAIAPFVRPAPNYEFCAADGTVLMQFDMPHTGTLSGWANGYMIHQPGIEIALRAKVDESELATILLGHSVSGARHNGESVEADVTGADGTRRMRARYLVACDGASSAIREAIGIGLHDFAFDEPWLVVDAIVRDPSRLPVVNLQICDPARPTTCVLMSAGRHRWEFMLLPGETAEQVLDDDFIQALLDPWDVGDAVTIDRKAVYRFHGLVAHRWRSGRIFFAGDAAHQMPPFAGQGMCSGLRDAANLAWKLAATIEGRADEMLLDSYQTERAPHVQFFIDLAINMGRVVCTLDPQVAAQRDAGMLAQRASGAAVLPAAPAPRLGPGHFFASAAAGDYFPQPWCANGTRLDDILGLGAWLITRDVTSTHGHAAVAITDARLFPFRDALGAWFDKHDAQAVLVRPDRYVFGTGSPADLVAAYDSEPALQLA
jgi:3-(3-hydroxy-phenyl)propionate hydroxylase